MNIDLVEIGRGEIDLRYSGKHVVLVRGKRRRMVKFKNVKLIQGKEVILYAKVLGTVERKRRGPKLL